MTLFLCGDVMLGRGIDQILPFPSAPTLHEPFVKSALQYVELAEKINGAIPRPVDFPYVWGDAIPELERTAPDIRIINLETSVTRSDNYWAAKEIHYRMNPGNMPCIKAAGIDCCSLANNHVLDWGYPGLLETLDSLHSQRVKTAGAGRNMEEAAQPARMEVAGKGRCFLFSLGSTTSGIPARWAATPGRPGVNLLHNDSYKELRDTCRRIRETKQAGDIVVVSLHWGPNWGYEVSDSQRESAHKLIQYGADVVHSHSSHHVKGIEVYMGKLILYGCGDFLNDYEGIEGYEQFRGDLGLMYFPSLEVESGMLISLRMSPTQVRRFRVNQAGLRDTHWLRGRLDKLCSVLGTRVEMNRHDGLILRWQ